MLHTENTVLSGCLTPQEGSVLVILTENQTFIEFSFTQYNIIVSVRFLLQNGQVVTLNYFHGGSPGDKANRSEMFFTYIRSLLLIKDSNI